MYDDPDVNVDHAVKELQQVCVPHPRIPSSPVLQPTRVLWPVRNAFLQQHLL